MSDTIKSRFQSEQGSALVITMLILVLVIVFIGMMMTQAMTLVTQTNTTGHVIEARTLAESGVDYYEAFVRENVKAQGVNSPLDINTAGIASDINETLDADQSFEISDIVIAAQPDNRVMITYEVTGTSYGQNSIVEAFIILQ